jgi:mycothiol S-conjugate amidase
MVKTILGIFPHPDDEVSAAGLLSRAVCKGIKVHLVCATRGEAGRIRNVVNPDYSKITEIRTNEINESSKRMGITSLSFLDLKDGKSCTWAAEDAGIKLDYFINKINPDIIVALKDSDNGHPDHRELSKLVRESYDRMNKGNMRLYFATKFPRSFLKKKFAFLPLSKNIKENLLRKYTIADDSTSFILKLNKKEIKLKISLIKCYKSQFPDDKGRYFYMPLYIFKKAARYECYNGLGTNQAIL